MACLSPFYGRHKGKWMPFPCGRCPPCKKRRVDSWVFRLLQEDKVSWSAHFITLTYDPSSVPISPNGFMTLDKSAFPLYMKRLRKAVKKFSCGEYRPLKYYACGEYGSKFKRPHYHAIVFNVPDDSLFFDAWKVDGVYFGDVHVGQVSGDSVAYCMKYIDKRTDFFHSRDDRVPEFSLMSKGLGKSYLSDAVVDYHKADLSRLYLTVQGGHKIALPRYYRNFVYDEDERASQASLIDLAVAKGNSRNYDTYLRLFGDVEGFSFDDFVQSQREHVVNSFYSQLKSRE